MNLFRYTKSIAFWLVFSIFAICGEASAQTVDDSRVVNGVWLYKGGFTSTVASRGVKMNFQRLLKEYPFVRGVLNPIPWSLLAPSPGMYNWDAFDKNLSEIADAGLYIGLMFWVGPHSPEWLYTNFGVEKVYTNTDKEKMPYFPNYKNPVYKEKWYEMIDSVAAHIEGLPASIKNKIVFYQAAEGTTGDEGAFKGVPLANSRQFYFRANDKWWIDFKRAELKHLYQLYTAGKNPPIHILFNGTDEPDEWEWAEKNIPNAWRKSNNIGHIYQANGDLLKKQAYDPYINVTPANSNATLIRTRDEFDGGFAPTYQEIPAWFTYWTALHSLHFGLDIWNLVGNKVLVNPLNLPAFQIFEKYAGYKNPALAPGAFCALRDGLDAADTKRFPVAEYGGGNETKNGGGQQRTVNIARHFAQRGARQEDPAGSMGSQVNNHHAKGINDVNWNIFPGNYERYITQYAPNETSIGYWSVGSKEQPYGRFARGFDQASGKNDMYFNVNDSLFKTFPNAGRQAITLRIVYFDNGGSWKVNYDAVGNTSKTALEVKNGNSGLWKEKEITITDANFGNRLPHGTDIIISNTDSTGEDAIFHMIEIRKQ